MNILIQPSKISGSVQPPSSKSLSHRALICAGLAEGKSTIRSISFSRDIQATIDCLKALGAHIEDDGMDEYENHTYAVAGCRPQDLKDPVTLDAYESGSTLRFFIPIAASGSEPVTFLGQPTLLSRPMGIYADLFLAQNLRFDQSGKSIRFQGPLHPGIFQIPGNVSSQFISGLLMAAPLLSDGKSETAIAVLGDYQSRSYTSLTVSAMKDFGVHVDEPSESGYTIAANQKYQPADLSVEADYSQMAFFGVLGTLNGSLTCLNLNPNSAQGDRVILDFLKEAGASLCWDKNSLNIESPALMDHSLRPLIMDLADCPDLGPILCVLAAFTPGESRLIHASRLRFKECDRIAAMEEELKKWGVDIESDEDSITIRGKNSYVMDHPVHIDSHNDHRIVMAMSVFGLCAQSDTVIENAEAINKSYPRFFEDLKRLKGKVSECTQMK